MLSVGMQMNLLYFLFLLAPIVLGGKVLIYSPSISFSHLISNGRIADTLVDAGHDVVMFIPEYMSTTSNFNGTKKAKVIRMNDIDVTFETMMKEFEPVVFESDALWAHERAYFEAILSDICNKIMLRRDELEVLREYKFDVAFSEQIDLCGVGIIRYLGIENHIWISTTPLMDAVSYNLGIPQPSSYVPTIEENHYSDVMTFWQRAYNMWMYVVFWGVHVYGTDGTTEVLRRYAGPSFPNVREIAANSSLCFVNTNEMFDFARPIIHKTIYIGGLGLTAPKPLPEKMANIMSKGKEGVVVFSLGTIAPFAAMSAEVKEGIIRSFIALPDYHFLIKISKGDNTTQRMISQMNAKNIDTVTWLPQSDLLGHPRLRLFVMHGGVNGLMEAVFRGVPLVVIPIFADQFRNAQNVVKRGMGKLIWKKDLNEETFSNALHTVLFDANYKNNALRMSKLVREVPFSAEERLKKWTQFTIDNGVLDTLHVEGSRLNTVVYFNLDLIAVALVVLFISLKILKALFCALFCKSLKKDKLD